MLGGESPLLACLVAIAAASWAAGRGPALAALVVTLIGAPWILPPAGAAAGVASSRAVSLGLFSTAALGIAQLGVRRPSPTTPAGDRPSVSPPHARLGDEAPQGWMQGQEGLLGELREKNASLTAILRQVPAGIVVAEAGTSRLLLSNDEAERIVRGGFQPGLKLEGHAEAQELAGFHADGSPYGRDDWPLMRSLHAGEVVADEEIELIFSDGARRRISVNSGPALDEAGRMVAAVAVFYDVTERRAAEFAVTESERVFRQLAEAIPQIVFITRIDDSVAYLNRRWFEYTGAAAPPEAAGGAPMSFVHPDDIPAIVAERSRSKESGEPLEIEYRLRGVDGAYRWFLGRSIWIRDESGGLVVRFGTATDIDDRKRSEQGARFLADSGSRLAAVADVESTLREIAGLAVPDFADWSAVDVLDESGELRRVAVAHDEGARPGVVDMISHRYRLRPDTPRGIFEVVETRQPTLISDVTEEHLRSGARNEEHLAALREFAPRSYLCVPLVGRERVLGALSFATTRSGRRYDEADLVLAVDLAARAAIAVENGMLYDRLREADRRKDDFLATLAHELRNPMAPIRNSVQILRMKGGGDADSEWARDVIERQVGHLARLVDDLLDVSRITRAKLEMRLERVELAAVVAAAVEISRPLLDGKGQELRLDIPPEPIALEADPTRLAQVFANLFDNASKFSDRGTRIDLQVEPRGTNVEVRVKDRGIGIPPHQLPHVFEMFAQFAPILERPQGGLGIGLALARGIVDLHGGAIEVRSAGSGQGSEFVVRLPRPVEAARDSGRAEAGEATASTARARVLIVDDNADIADSLGRMLSLQGCEVHLANDGDRAFVMAGALRPDFAVLDIGLPGMNGYDLAGAIRREPWGRDITLIAVTGWGQDNDRKRSAEAGFDHHLVKPVAPTTLVQIISGPSRTKP